MKIICRDNFNRETVSDQLIAEGLEEHMGALILAQLTVGAAEDEHYILVEDSYELYKAPQEADAEELDRKSLGWRIATDLLSVTLKAFGPMRQSKLISWRVNAAKQIDEFIKQLPR